MTRTYTSLHYHIVFGTKHREPWLNAAWRVRLHEYPGGIINGLDGFSQGVGGVADHVHMLAGLKATHRLSDVVREIRKTSNAWIQDEMGVQGFAWQEGYAAFTISATAQDAVKNTSPIRSSAISRWISAANCRGCLSARRLISMPNTYVEWTQKTAKSRRPHSSRGSGIPDPARGPSH